MQRYDEETACWHIWMVFILCPKKLDHQHKCFAENLTTFPAVKELWKSVETWRSYRHEFGFWSSFYGRWCVFHTYWDSEMEKSWSTCLQERNNASKLHTSTLHTRRSVYCRVEYTDVSQVATKKTESRWSNGATICCVPRRYSVDVEIRKCDIDARFVCAVEEIVALDVAWVQTGVVGWRERAVRRHLVVERERAVLCANTQSTQRRITLREWMSPSKGTSWRARLFAIYENSLPLLPCRRVIRIMFDWRRPTWCPVKGLHFA